MDAPSYWSVLDRHTDWSAFWMGPPAVRARINRRVTGDPARWPISWLPDVVAGRAPFRRALSVGCGLGAFERSLVELGVVDGLVTGIDASEETLARARQSAQDAWMESRICYLAGNARAFLDAEHGFDAVFFHASLHHFDRLPDLLARVRRALAPRGVLYLDEYVGPSRGEWTPAHRARWNFEYYRLPREVRRTRIVRPPVTEDDPTEMIESSGILGAVAGEFDVVARRDYGGNLLMPIFPSLRRPDQPGGPTAEALDAVIEGLLDREERLMARGAPSFHTVLVAVKRAG